MIRVNRGKAEAIVYDRLRDERTAELQKLDVAYMQAIESGADTSSIVEQKTKLREITEKDFSNLSIEELAGIDLEKALAIP